MLNLEELCLRKPSKSRKPVRAEKKKTKQEDPVPEPETVAVVEPASPKVRRTPRKKDAKKGQGIVIHEGQGAPEAKKLPPLLLMTREKGCCMSHLPPQRGIKQTLHPSLFSQRPQVG